MHRWHKHMSQAMRFVQWHRCSPDAARDGASCSSIILILPGTPLSPSRPAAAQLQLESTGLHEHQHQDQQFR